MQDTTGSVQLEATMNDSENLVNYWSVRKFCKLRGQISSAL